MRHHACVLRRAAAFGLAWSIAIVLAVPALGGENENVIESFAVDGSGDLLLIPVTVAGAQHQFILDTGCTVSVFDDSLKGALRSTGEMVPLNGGMPLELFECQDAAVGKSMSKLGKFAACFDLHEIRKYSGHDVRGILGLNFLRRFVVQIDFDAGCVSLLKAADTIPGERIPMAIDRPGCLTVDLTLPSLGPTPFVVDTGNIGFRSGCLSKSTFESLSRAGQIDVLAGKSRDAEFAGISEGRVGMIRQQTLGRFKHRRQIFTEGRFDSLGIGYLSRFRVTLDYPNWQLILEPGKRFARTSPANIAGIDIDVVEQRLIVRDVDRDGLAWNSGIRPRDEIVAVDGVSAHEMPLLDVGASLYICSDGLLLKIAAADSKVHREVRLSRTK